MVSGLRLTNEEKPKEFPIQNGQLVFSNCECPHTPKVFLTFDDGPNGASTLKHARKLAELKVHATYFWLGEQLSSKQANHEDWHEIRRLGHAIGSHGWSHYDLGKHQRGLKQHLAETNNHSSILLQDQDLGSTSWCGSCDKEVLESKALIESKTGSPVKLFRYPYGNVAPAYSPMGNLVKNNYQRVIQSDIDGGDASHMSSLPAVLESIDRQWKAGNHGHIILLHESSRASSDLEEIVKHIRRKCPLCQFLNIEEGCSCAAPPPSKVAQAVENRYMKRPVKDIISKH